MLDLSALDEKVNSQGQGVPLEVDLTLIEEDPKQPRNDFNKDSLNELAESIKQSGVKQPVSLRKHPEKQGMYMLNFGARRYRASLLAGIKTIPAFIDETSNDFDQVIENEQRENLTPMEMALFIKKKLDEGVTQKEIAERLGKQKTAITFYTALINPPAFIEEIYRSGKSTSPATLYELKKLHEKHPEKTEKWINDTTEITRSSVSDLGKALKQTDEPKIKTEKIETKLNTGDASSWADKDSSALLKKPLLIVEFNGRAAAAMLNKKPSSPGLIYIKYEDDGSEEEVYASQLSINMLTDSHVKKG